MEFIDKKSAVSQDNIWNINCDRLKAFYQQTIAKGGHCYIIAYELKDKIASMDQGGDACGGLFLIQASEQRIPGRGFSTSTCCTPEIKGAAVSVVAGTTAQTLHELIYDYGLAGVGRRCWTLYFPIRNLNVYDEMKMAEDRDDSINFSMDIDIYRLYCIYKAIYYKDDQEKNDENDPTTLLRKNIPVISISTSSEITRYKYEYIKEHPEDQTFSNIQYPVDWLNGDGSIKLEKFTGMFFIKYYI